MTVLDRIVSIVGDYSQPQTGQDKLDEATRIVLGELPEEVLLSMSVEETDDGTTGVDVTNKRIISAHKAGYNAKRVRADLKTRLDDAATGEGYPVYYVEGNTAYVQPDGGTVRTLTPPSLKLQSDYPTGTPHLLLDAIVAKAAMLIMDSKMVREQNDYNQTITLPTVPVPPPSPSITYAEAIAIAPSASLIVSPSATLTYTESSAALTPSPGVGTLDLTALIGGDSYVRPTAPSAPTFEYNEVVAIAPSATQIAALPAAPEYVVQLPNQTTPPTSGNVDLTLKVDGSALTPPTAPTAPVLDSIGISTPTIAASPSAPDYSDLSGLAQDFADWQTYYDNEETDMMDSVAGKIQVELQQRRLNVESKWNEFQGDFQIYAKELDKTIEQARLLLQEQSQEMDSNLQAQVQSWIGRLDAFKSQSELFLGETNLYRAEAELVLAKFNAEFQNDLALFRINKETDVAEFGARIQDASNLLQANLTVYNATVGRNQAQAQISAQEAAQTAQIETETTLGNKSRKIQAELENYANALAHFRVLLDQETQDVGHALQEWVTQAQIDVDIWFKTRTTDLEKYSLDIQNNRGTLEKTITELNEESNRKIKAAEIARSEAQQTASQATEISVMNAAKNMEAKINQFSSQMALFAQQISLFSSQAEVVFAKQKIDTESKNAKLRLMNFDRQRIEQSYETKKAAYLRYAWPHRSYQIRQPII